MFQKEEGYDLPITKWDDLNNKKRQAEEKLFIYNKITQVAYSRLLREGSIVEIIDDNDLSRVTVKKLILVSPDKENREMITIELVQNRRPGQKDRVVIRSDVKLPSIKGEYVRAYRFSLDVTNLNQSAKKTNQFIGMLHNTGEFTNITLNNICTSLFKFPVKK